MSEPPPSQEQRVTDLLREEKANRRKVTAGVLAALLLFDSPGQLKTVVLAGALAGVIQDAHERATDLAEDHTGADLDSEEDDQGQLLTDAASAALAAILVRSVQAAWLDDEGAAYKELATQAAQDNAKRIATTADTEFYRAYNEAWIDGTIQQAPQAEIEWVAVLDKRTCPRCDALDGKRVKASVGFRINPPLHPRCRCFLERAT